MSKKRFISIFALGIAVVILIGMGILNIVERNIQKDKSIEKSKLLGYRKYNPSIFKTEAEVIIQEVKESKDYLRFIISVKIVPTKIPCSYKGIIVKGTLDKSLKKYFPPWRQNLEFGYDFNTIPNYVLDGIKNRGIDVGLATFIPKITTDSNKLKSLFVKDIHVEIKWVGGYATFTIPAEDVNFVYKKL
ncbi:MULTISPECIES: hypothetical protein [unclassified Caldicellulosiruptor]|uniref:hypothetical protein n=1 Tax=unclassified Caldicellulosiruptor TaxID=2622462 RepID=UPI0003A1299F|nr:MULTISPECIES: hypothetical protein [unclassified Caldicellulosiruptor]